MGPAKLEMQFATTRALAEYRPRDNEAGAVDGVVYKT